MMNLRKTIAALVVAAVTCTQAHAQQVKSTDVRNQVKVNLAGLAVRNYQFQYERILSRRFSVALSYRTMPQGPIPFKQKLLDIVNDPDFAEAVTSMEISGSAITPEVRIYLGKGYGKGFYIAPFYRNASFDASKARVSFETFPGQTESISLSGTTKTHTAGLLLGAQWALGKHLSLDWWILGPHVGNGNADLKGVPSKTLSAYEQQQLRNELERMEFPLETKEVNVGPNSGQVKLGGTMGGLRAGLSLGVRF